eukprot:UN04561
MVMGICDEDCVRLNRCFNEENGHEYLKSLGVSDEVCEQLQFFGISAIANTLGLIKMAKYYEMTSEDCLFTVATDGANMYASRVEEARKLQPQYTEHDAGHNFQRSINQRLDSMIEMTYYEKKRMHNLKYYTT